MIRRRVISIIAFLSCAMAMMGEGAAKFIVSGRCLVRERGTIVLYLVDERGFDTPMSGIREVRVPINEADLAAGGIPLHSLNLFFRGCLLLLFAALTAGGRLALWLPALFAGFVLALFRKRVYCQWFCPTRTANDAIA